MGRTPPRCASLPFMSIDSAVSISVIVTGAATIATAVVAMYALSGSRQDSRERTRPVLVASLKREPVGHGGINLILHNHGASAARDINVRFDPPLANADELPDSDMFRWIGLRYSRTIPLLAPGQTLSNVFRAGQDEIDAVTMKITYSSSEGRGYHDHFLLDPEVLLKETRSTPGDSNDRDLRLIKAVEAVVRAVDRP